MFVTSVNVLVVTNLTGVGAICFKSVTESKERCRYWAVVFAIENSVRVCFLQELSLSFLLVRTTEQVAHTLANLFRQMFHLSRTRTMHCSNIDLVAIVGEKSVAYYFPSNISNKKDKAKIKYTESQKRESRFTLHSFNARFI
jgi:hypothetical protein